MFRRWQLVYREVRWSNKSPINNVMLQLLPCLSEMSAALLCILKIPPCPLIVSLDMHCTCTVSCGRKVIVLPTYFPGCACEHSSRSCPNVQSSLLLHRYLVLDTSVAFPVTSHRMNPQALVHERVTTSDGVTAISGTVILSRAAEGCGNNMRRRDRRICFYMLSYDTATTRVAEHADCSRQALSL